MYIGNSTPSGEFVRKHHFNAFAHSLECTFLAEPRLRYL